MRHSEDVMGRMSRQKGKRGERECAAELGALLGIGYGADGARRGVQYQGGNESPDVVLPGCAIHVEAKRVESLALYPAVEQARGGAPASSVPIVWHRRNGKPSVCIVETTRLLDLARELVRVADRPEAPQNATRTKTLEK
jgi:hypothetical protein